MDNNETPQIQNKSILDLEEYQELAKLITEASKLNAEDSRKLKEIEALFINETEKPDWNFFSIMAIRGLLYGYENGELSFEKMMRIAWNCVLPLRNANLGFHTMGALAAIAVKIEPKKRNAKKPPFPMWIKKAAVEYALLVHKVHPKIKSSYNKDGEDVDSIPALTLKQLALFHLDIGEGGNRLSEKTIYEWLTEHKRKNNIPLQNRGKKRQEKLKPNLS